MKTGRYDYRDSWISVEHLIRVIFYFQKREKSGGPDQEPGDQEQAPPPAKKHGHQPTKTGPNNAQKHRPPLIYISQNTPKGQRSFLAQESRNPDLYIRILNNQKHAERHKTGGKNE